MLIFISESWLTKYVHDKDTCIDCCDFYHSHSQRGSGVAVAYIKCNIDLKLVLTDSVSKELELLAELSAELSIKQHTTLADCDQKRKLFDFLTQTGSQVCGSTEPSLISQNNFLEVGAVNECCPTLDKTVQSSSADWTKLKLNLRAPI